MGKGSGSILRFTSWFGRRCRFAGLSVLALGLISAAWIGIAEVNAGWVDRGSTGEIAEREAVKQSVRDLFDKSNYSALESLASQYRASGARTPSGVWRLTVFYAAFQGVAGAIAPDDQTGWQRLSTKLADWQGRFPAQPTAVVAQAIALKSYAWALRPRTVVFSASTGADAKFMAALNNARNFLDAEKAVASADPHYYVLRTDVGTAVGEAPDQIMGIVAEGRTKFPGYFALDFSGLDYFAAGDGTKAPGPAEAARVAAFVETAMADAGSDAGERYARLYWHAYSSFYGNDLFKRSLVDWQRLRNGMQAIAAHYPDAWNANMFAYFACLAGDRPTTRKLMDQLPERPLLTAVWQARPVFAGCRKWASAETAKPR
jgi:hypothetical protein